MSKLPLTPEEKAKCVDTLRMQHDADGNGRFDLDQQLNFFYAPLREESISARTPVTAENVASTAGYCNLMWEVQCGVVFPYGVEPMPLEAAAAVAKEINNEAMSALFDHNTDGKFDHEEQLQTLPDMVQRPADAPNTPYTGEQIKKIAEAIVKSWQHYGSAFPQGMEVITPEQATALAVKVNEKLGLGHKI